MLGVGESLEQLLGGIDIQPHANVGLLPSAAEHLGAAEAIDNRRRPDLFYLEDRERTLESPTDELMLSVTAFADELEREKARQRTYDALRRRAECGYVTGGRVFGYDNARDTAGVRRVINPDEAAVVRRIFELALRFVDEGSVMTRSFLAPTADADEP